MRKILLLIMLAGKNQPNYENLCCQLINDKSVLKIYDMYVCMICIFIIYDIIKIYDMYDMNVWYDFDMLLH